MIHTIKNNLKTFCFVLFISLFSVNSFSQEDQLKKANDRFEHLAFVDAAEIYQDVANSGYRSVELFTRLGDTYYFNSKYQMAAKSYGELFAMTKDLEPIYYLRYAQSLKSIKSDDLAAEYYDKYLKVANLNNSRIDAKTAMQMVEENSGRYTIKKLPFNSSGIDFGTAFLKDKIIFSSTRDTGSVFKKRSGWDGYSFLDLYEVTMDSSGDGYSNIKRLKGDFEDKYHESTPIFTKDGKTVYFTRNNFSEDPEFKDDKEQMIRLKIYKAELVEDRWTNIQDLSINGDRFSTAHPALNKEENKLYFASNRPESIGETDLFYVDINSDGTLGQVTSLGDNINTAGRESFPFISDNNDLYFSSDGHFGLGGYDVFYTKIAESNFSNNVLNVGKPVNSEFDDVCYIVGKDKLGYISSNRLDTDVNTTTGKSMSTSTRENARNVNIEQNEESLDNIYQFTENEPIKDFTKSKIYGVVVDGKDNPIPNASVLISNENNEKITTLKTNEKGYYEYLNIAQKDGYVLKATKPTYTDEDLFSEKSEKDREHNFKLIKDGTILLENADNTVYEVKKGDDLAKILNIIIHFDYAKWNIRNDAEVELEKLISVMKKHPSIKVDVRSHTDSRAIDEYNQTLSDKRARSTIAYIVNRGISLDRITGRGYGESTLLNGCSNKIKCTEEEHQKNRRSEFIVK